MLTLNNTGERHNIFFQGDIKGFNDDLHKPRRNQEYDTRMEYIPLISRNCTRTAYDTRGKRRDCANGCIGADSVTINHSVRFATIGIRDSVTRGGPNSRFVHSGPGKRLLLHAIIPVGTETSTMQSCPVNHYLNTQSRGYHVFHVTRQRTLKLTLWLHHGVEANCSKIMLLIIPACAILRNIGQMIQTIHMKTGVS